MKISDLFKQKAVIAKKPEIVLAPFNLEQAPPSKAKEWIKEMKNWVYPNIYAIAEPVSNIEFELYQLKGNDDVAEIEQHPVLDLLGRCNNFMTQHKVIFTYVMHRKLVGEAAWLIARTGGEIGEPVEIWPLRPDWITPVPGDLSKDEYIKHYLYKIEGTEKVISPNNLIFFTEPNAESPYRGKGTVQAAAEILDVDNYARDWNRNQLYNGGSSGGVFSTDQRLTEEALKRIEKQMKQKYTGSQNAGKYMILEGGLKLEQDSKTPKDLDFNVGRERSRDEIAAMFRNPKTALGITDDVNRANAEATEYVHAKNVIKTEMQKLVDELNEFLLPMFKGTENMFLSFCDPVPENYELKFRKYELVNKVYTINEARAEEGLEPVDGGDVIYLPINLTPMGKEPQIKMLKVRKKDRLTKGDILKKRFRKEIRRIKNKNVRNKLLKAQLEESVKKALQVMVVKKQPIKNKTIKDVPETFGQKYQKVLHNYIAVYEGKMQSLVMNKWYPELEKSLLSKLPKKSIKSITNIMFDEEEAISTGIDLFTPLMEVLATDVGKEALEAIAAGSDYELSSVLDNLLKTRMRDSVVSVVDTAKGELKNLIANGVKEGKSIPQIRDDIKGWFDKPYQAERFARTEVSKAANMSTLDAWKESGLVDGKEWVLDGKPCEICIPLGGEKVGIDETFSDGSMEPPDPHPNCMCSTAPVFGKSKQAKSKKLTKEDLIDNLLKEYDEGETR